MLKSSAGWVRSEADAGWVPHFVWRLYTLGMADYPRLLLGVAQAPGGWKLEALRMNHPDLRQDVPVPAELLGEAATLLRAAQNRLNGSVNGCRADPS